MDEFKTLRGFLVGEEPDNEPYFAYSATLRIQGEGLNFDEIQENLGVAPSDTHRKGEPRRNPNASPWPCDHWDFTAPLDEDEPLFKHIDSLWSTIRHAESYLRFLRESAEVDVFLGFRSNNDMAGVEIPHTSLELFRRLEIPVSLSIIIA